MIAFSWPQAAELRRHGIEWLSEKQDRLYAQDQWSMLLIFQAMDAAGKDSTIKHVMSGVNPQGCQVFAFKQPSSEELDHDFMWRYIIRLPERGRIGIFNRSYYEEVLVLRVDPEMLDSQKIPRRLLSKGIWDERLADIVHFEDYVSRQGTKILKLFLYVSREEQKKRFTERLDEPEKSWKFSPSDVKEREFWGQYMDAFEEAIRATASKHAPWLVVPARRAPPSPIAFMLIVRSGPGSVPFAPRSRPRVSWLRSVARTGVVQSARLRQRLSPKIR